MSNNIDKNQNIIKLASGRTFDLKKLDRLVGQTTLGSIFKDYDKLSKGGNDNNLFDVDEINTIKEKLIQYQESDNSVSEAEVKELLASEDGENNLGASELETLLSELENENRGARTFDNTLEQAQEAGLVETFEQPEATDNNKEEKNSKQSTLTKYTVQPGDTPEVIAKNLGLTGEEAKNYARQLAQHFKDNGFVNSRGWLMVGQEITLLGDHKDALNNMVGYSTDKEVLNARYAQTSHARSVAKKAQKETYKLPDWLERISADISKEYGQCNIQKGSDGSYKISYKSGNLTYEKIYDANGTMKSIIEKFSDGSERKGTPDTEGNISWVTTKVSDEKRRQLLLPSEVGYPSAVGDKIALLRNAGIKFSTIKTDDGNFVLKFDKTFNWAVPNNKNLTNYLMSFSSFNEASWILDKNGNTLEERQADLFTETITTYTNGQPKTVTRNREFTSPTKPTQKANSQSAQEQSKPKSAEEMTSVEKFIHLKHGERNLPENIQNKIINYRLQGKEINLSYLEMLLPEAPQGKVIDLAAEGMSIIDVKNVYDENNQLIAYRIEYQKEEDISIPYRNTNNSQLMFVDLKGNEIPPIDNPSRLAAVQRNDEGREVSGQEVTYRNLDKGRQTTDKVAAKINMKIPEHLGDSQQAIAYAQGLERNKAALMAQFGITNEQYDTLAVLAMGIAEQETHFGEAWFTTTDGSSTDFQRRSVGKQALDAIYYGEYENSASAQAIKIAILRMVPGQIFLSDEQKNAIVRTMVFEVGGFVSDDISEYGEKYTDGTKSYGMTQAKIDQFMKEPAIAEQLKEFGITCGEDIRKDPEKQAIATIIILNNKRIQAEQNNWQEYLNNNNANIPDPNMHLNTNDLIALLWNGNSSKLNALKEGNLVLQKTENDDSNNVQASYARNVRAYTNSFFGAETTFEEQKRADHLGAIPQGNNGQLGTVIFLANKYSTNIRNNARDIETLINALNKSSVPKDKAEALIQAVKRGDISFGHGLTEDEASSITTNDVLTMLASLKKAKENTANLVDPAKIRDAALSVQDEFRANYLASRQFIVSNSDISSANTISTMGSSEIIDERLVERRETNVTNAHRNGKGGGYQRAIARDNAKINSGVYTGFAVQADLGVNPYDANGNLIPNEYRELAEYASDVTKDLATGGQCLTGVKVALESAGVIKKNEITYPRNVNTRVQNGATFLSIAKAHGYSGKTAQDFANNLEKRIKNNIKIDNDGNLIAGKTITLKNAEGQTVRHTIKADETIEQIVRQYGHTGNSADEYAQNLYNNLLNDRVLDANGNLIEGKLITVHQAGTPIAVARDADLYFAAHPEKFEEVKYIDLGNGSSREINASDIRNLPAGYIVVFEPGAGFENQAGHIVITNGNGQGYADEVDNLRWDDYVSAEADNNGKGEHGTYKIYRLKVEQ